MDIREKIRGYLGAGIVEWREHSGRRIYITIRKEDILKSVRFLFCDLGLRFSIASGTDTTAGLEILYHFSYDQTGEVYSLKVLIDDKNNPEIDSITPIFPGAEWIEREIFELLGIKFTGHPNLKRLLLADDWPEGNYPLRRKDAA